ncbi:MAG: acylphosphatase [Candidatus Peregrinibacteria bacterium]
MIRVHLTIHGLVQGVFFRAETKKQAQELGVTGFVANNSDGTVSVVAEGPENLIQQLTDWCNSGPSRAQVQKVDAETHTYTGEFEGFEIRY